MKNNELTKRQDSLIKKQHELNAELRHLKGEIKEIKIQIILSEFDTHPTRKLIKSIYSEFGLNQTKQVMKKLIDDLTEETESEKFYHQALHKFGDLIEALATQKGLTKSSAAEILNNAIRRGNYDQLDFTERQLQSLKFCVEHLGEENE